MSKLWLHSLHWKALAAITSGRSGLALTGWGFKGTPGLVWMGVGTAGTPGMFIEGAMFLDRKWKVS